MIRRLLFLALACLCFVLGIISLSCSDSGADAKLPKLPPMGVDPYPGLQRSDVTLAIELSDERPIRTIFRALPWQPADSEYAHSVAEKLGVVGEPKQEADGSYIVKSELGEVEIRQSVGNFDYTPSVPKATSVSSAQPGDDELKAAAEAFLSGHDLLPQHARAVSVSYNEYTSRRTVRIEDERLTPSLGLTPFINVNFEAGAVSSVGSRWQPIEALGDYPLLSEKEAFERLFKDKGRIGIMTDKAVTISSVQLAFHVTGNQEEGIPTFFPFYYFRGEKDSQYAWVPAVPDKYLEKPPQ